MSTINQTSAVATMEASVRGILDVVHERDGLLEERRLLEARVARLEAELEMAENHAALMQGERDHYMRQAVEAMAQMNAAISSLGDAAAKIAHGRYRANGIAVEDREQDDAVPVPTFLLQPLAGNGGSDAEKEI